MNTIGKLDVKHLVNLFDSIVSSVFRYGFGAWGPVAGKLEILDRLFVHYVIWLFGLPRSSCRKAILACFGRRCASCDSLFLASVQLAKGFSSRAELWGTVSTVAHALRERSLKGSKWYKKVIVALEERALRDEVWDRPSEFLIERKSFGIKFSQFCFHRHLNLARGTSADEIRELQPFGIYPFLLRNPPGLSRFLFSFVLSNWRWLNKGECSRYPRECVQCEEYNSSYHILFDCVLFSEERDEFISEAGVPFEFACLTIDEPRTAKAAAILGKRILAKLSEMTRNGV